MRFRRILPARYREQDNPLKTERLVELWVVVLSVIVVLVLCLGLVLQASSGGPQPMPPSADSLELKALKLENPLASGGVEAVLARPLFWEGRRPLVPVSSLVTAPTPVRPSKLEGVTLHGVFGAGDSLGLIATVDGRMGRIAVGQSVKGWQLSTYEGGVAVFSKGKNRATLPLELTTPSVNVTRMPVDKAERDDVAEAVESANDPAQPTQNNSKPTFGQPGNSGDGLSFGGSSKPKVDRGSQ